MSKQKLTATGAQLILNNKIVNMNIDFDDFWFSMIEHDIVTKAGAGLTSTEFNLSDLYPLENYSESYRKDLFEFFKKSISQLGYECSFKKHHPSNDIFLFINWSNNKHVLFNWKEQFMGQPFNFNYIIQ